MPVIQMYSEGIDRLLWYVHVPTESGARIQVLSAAGNLLPVLDTGEQTYKAS